MAQVPSSKVELLNFCVYFIVVNYLNFKNISSKGHARQLYFCSYNAVEMIITIEKTLYHEVFLFLCYSSHQTGIQILHFM